MRLTWKKDKRERFQAGPPGRALRLDGREVAHVLPVLVGWRQEQNGWYWHTVGLPFTHYRNTCNTPVPLQIDAEEQAKQYIKDLLNAGVKL